MVDDDRQRVRCSPAQSWFIVHVRTSSELDTQDPCKVELIFCSLGPILSHHGQRTLEGLRGIISVSGRPVGCHAMIHENCRARAVSPSCRDTFGTRRIRRSCAELRKSCWLSWRRPRIVQSTQMPLKDYHRKAWPIPPKQSLRQAQNSYYTSSITEAQVLSFAALSRGPSL